LHRYEEAREVEKLRNQKEDFSDMVAEVGFHSHSSLHTSIFELGLVKSNLSLFISFVECKQEKEKAGKR
jgi:hypothetical protein